MGDVIAYLHEMDILLLFAVVCKFFFHALLVYYFMYKLLPNRLNIYTLIILSLIYTLWSCLNWGSSYGTTDNFGTAYHFWMNMFINAWTYFVVLFLFRGKLFKRLLVWWYFDVTKTMCEVVAYAPVMLYHAYKGLGNDWAQIVMSVESDTAQKLLHMSVTIPLFLLLGYLSLAIWRGILMRKFQPFYIFLLALPLGVKYSLSSVFHPAMGDWFLGILINFTDIESSYYILSLFGIFVGIVASIAVFYYILSQDKRAAIEAELMEAKRLAELEHARYSEVEKRSEELAKLRHDFNNQLASIVQLVRAGEDSTAQEIISALDNEINSTKTT